MKFTTLEGKARAAIKTRPEFREFELEKSKVAKGFSIGKFSGPQAKALMRLNRLRLRLAWIRELYKLMRAGGAA
jgi:hypothetical protein